MSSVEREILPRPEQPPQTFIWSVAVRQAAADAFGGSSSLTMVRVCFIFEFHVQSVTIDVNEHP
jgi:hypothetical protein